jgi:hypothetical protein
LLGDFETGFWARSAVSALATRRQPQPAGDWGVWHGQESFSLASSCDYSEFNESQVRLDNDSSTTSFFECEQERSNFCDGERVMVRWLKMKGVIIGNSISRQFKARQWNFGAIR